jgi:F-type H+-transporting ATPase subunit a
LAQSKILLSVAGIAGLLMLIGLIIGPVGAALFQGGAEEAFLPVPEVHLAPQPIFHLGGFAVTNTLLSAWLTTIVVVLLFVGGTRKMQVVPSRFQNVIEIFIEALYGFMAGVVGERFARSFFPVLGTIFIFVAFNAWIALLPIYPSVGFFEEGSGHITTHLLRSAGTDINMPLALAIISFVFVEAWGLKVHKVPYLREFFRFGGIFNGIIKRKPGAVFYGAIDAFVGLLELLSHFIRLLSFTFRLFGNMLAGEIVLFMVTFLVLFIAPLAFYFLEILVGGVQALIFTGLTLVFSLMAVAPHEDGHEEHATEGAH